MSIVIRIGVALAEGKHLFPFRTEKLSPPAPMVLPGRPGGRVGRCPLITRAPAGDRRGFFAGSLVSGPGRRWPAPAVLAYPEVQSDSARPFEIFANRWCHKWIRV